MDTTLKLGDLVMCPDLFDGPYNLLYIFDSGLCKLSKNSMKPTLVPGTFDVKRLILSSRQSLTKPEKDLQEEYLVSLGRAPVTKKEDPKPFKDGDLVEIEGEIQHYTLLHIEGGRCKLCMPLGTALRPGTVDIKKLKMVGSADLTTSERRLQKDYLDSAEFKADFNPSYYRPMIGDIVEDNCSKEESILLYVHDNGLCKLCSLDYVLRPGHNLLESFTVKHAHSITDEGMRLRNSYIGSSAYQSVKDAVLFSIPSTKSVTPNPFKKTSDFSLAKGDFVLVSGPQIPHGMVIGRVMWPLTPIRGDDWAGFLNYFEDGEIKGLHFKKSEYRKIFPAHPV